MLNIGDMVALRIFQPNNPRPIGVIVAHERGYNIVKWINDDMQLHRSGGYTDISLDVLSKAEKKTVDTPDLL